jgi:hypothetical protein
MAGWTESSGATGKIEEAFLATGWTADAGKPAFRVAAVKVALDYLLDDRTEVAIFSLKPILIIHHEPVEIMEKHAVEDGALRVTWTINSWHGRREESRNRPGMRKER